jgi:hypothetical protein
MVEQRLIDTDRDREGGGGYLPRGLDGGHGHRHVDRRRRRYEGEPGRGSLWERRWRNVAFVSARAQVPMLVFSTIF